MIMETNYILSGILYCLGCAFLIWASDRIKRYSPERHGLTIVLMWLCAVFFVLSIYGIMSNDYRDGQIDALKGKYKYRMEINYDQHGTPKDTIYIKL